MPSKRQKIVTRMTKKKNVALQTGPNGGTYYITKGGNKVYVTKTGIKVRWLIASNNYIKPHISGFLIYSLPHIVGQLFFYWDYYIIKYSGESSGFIL